MQLAVLNLEVGNAARPGEMRHVEFAIYSIVRAKILDELESSLSQLGS
jgi:hypothetical protein